MSDGLKRKVDRLDRTVLRTIASMATLRESVDLLRTDLASYRRLADELRATLTTMPRRDTAPGG